MRRRQQATPQAKTTRRSYDLERRVGITLETYDEMFASQGGLCAICNQPETRRHKNGELFRLAVDHCHKTDEVRALLCGRCNTMLGQIEAAQSVKGLLDAMLNYLVRHGKNSCRRLHRGRRGG